MKKHFSNILSVLVFFVGLSVLCYPSFSNWWNSHTQSGVMADYDNAVEHLTSPAHIEMMAQADDYNDRLRDLGSSAALSDPDQLSGYEETLDINGSGMMARVEIEKIDLKLPVYHGTDESVLQFAAGHIEGTSLPVGGEGTHSVISAHRGLPRALLFSYLDQLEVGDEFTLHVLDEILTYRVVQVEVILPTDLEHLYIEEDKDYCTLMTCTPYGINSHRLLVKGERIETAPPAPTVMSDARELNSLWAAPLVAGPVLLLTALGLMLVPRRRKE